MYSIKKRKELAISGYLFKTFSSNLDRPKPKIFPRVRTMLATRSVAELSKSPGAK